MKKFVLMHIGFEQPTAEIMAAWQAWFEKAAPQTLDNIGYFMKGREISREGTRDLPAGPDSITGLTIIEAESFEAAEALAAENPYITAVRVYELQQG